MYIVAGHRGAGVQLRLTLWLTGCVILTPADAELLG
jgi:hypothetical protein